VGEGEREGHRSLLAGALHRISREPTASNRIFITIIHLSKKGEEDDATSRVSSRADHGNHPSLC
jgi:hypothetical protein